MCIDIAIYTPHEDRERMHYLYIQDTHRVYYLNYNKVYAELGPVLIALVSLLV